MFIGFNSSGSSPRQIDHKDNPSAPFFKEDSSIFSHFYFLPIQNPAYYVFCDSVILGKKKFRR